MPDSSNDKTYNELLGDTGLLTDQDICHAGGSLIERHLAATATGTQILTATRASAHAAR